MSSGTKLFAEISNNAVVEPCGDALNIVGYCVPRDKLEELEKLLSVTIRLPATKLWAGKIATYDAEEIKKLLRDAGVNVEGE